MALSGTLKDFALPDIFQLIGMQRKTGLLTLESERETVSVVFEQGMVVHADSTVRRLDDLLGNVLVRQSKLRKEILEEALAKQKVSMQRLGFILTSQGYIKSDDLRSALSEQVQQIVFRVFRWKAGRYHFDPSADADYDRENVTPVSTDHILMEGIRRVDEWPIIEKRIPTLDFVFRPLVPNKAIKVENASEGESGALGAAFDGLEGGGNGGNTNPTSEVLMNSTEALIYKLLDGKTVHLDDHGNDGTVRLRRLPDVVRFHGSQSRCARGTGAGKNPATGVGTGPVERAESIGRSACPRGRDGSDGGRSLRIPRSAVPGPDAAELFSPGGYDNRP